MVEATRQIPALVTAAKRTQPAAKSPAAVNPRAVNPTSSPAPIPPNPSTRVTQNEPIWAVSGDTRRWIRKRGGHIRGGAVRYCGGVSDIWMGLATWGVWVPGTVTVGVRPSDSANRIASATSLIGPAGTPTAVNALNQ